jgi:type II secretory ATPase GspE/PulE/Tfp pilus assembly ATPase PilB-like protein
MSDPGDFDTVQKLQFILNKPIHPVLASREQIAAAISRHYGESETESVDSMLVEFTDTAIDFTETEALPIDYGPPTEGRILDVGGMPGEAVQESGPPLDAISDAVVVKLVNLIIQEAVNLKAGVIRIEPFTDRVCVYYRIKGKLVERDNPPKRLQAPILARLKIMASLDIAETGRPQIGLIRMNLNGKRYKLLLGVVPTVHGEAAVIRIPAVAGEDTLVIDLKPFAPRALAMLKPLAGVPGYSPGMYRLHLFSLAPQLAAFVAELFDAGASQPEVESLARFAAELEPFARGEAVDDATAAHLFEGARVALANFVILADPTLAIPPMLE